MKLYGFQALRNCLAVSADSFPPQVSFSKQCLKQSVWDLTLYDIIDSFVRIHMTCIATKPLKSFFQCPGTESSRSPLKSSACVYLASSNPVTHWGKPAFFSNMCQEIRLQSKTRYNPFTPTKNICKRNRNCVCTSASDSRRRKRKTQRQRRFCGWLHFSLCCRSAFAPRSRGPHLSFLIGL